MGQISKSHQFFVMSKGRVATRNHSCWCSACHGQVTKGGADGEFQSALASPGCAHSGEVIYAWRNESCAQEGGGSVASAWASAKEKRQPLR